MFKKVRSNLSNLVFTLKTGQGACALALFALPFFLLNAHEFFPKESNCFKWIVVEHCASSFGSYYEFVYRTCYYLSVISWLVAAYLFHSRLSRTRWIYLVGVAFCIARLINVVSSKQYFGWGDELINFLIVGGVIRMGFYVFKRKEKKELTGEDMCALFSSHYKLVDDVDKKIGVARKLLKNNKIELEDYAKRIEVQSSRLHQGLDYMNKVIELKEDVI